MSLGVGSSQTPEGENWSAAYDKWEKSLHHKDFDLSKDLQGGAWNRVSLVLTPAHDDELQHLVIKMKTKSISLRLREN
jgi:hypothetical protein